MFNDLSAFARILIKAWQNDKLHEVGVALVAAERSVEVERRMVRARKPMPAPRYVQMHIDGRLWQVLQREPVVIGIDQNGQEWELRPR